MPTAVPSARTSWQKWASHSRKYREILADCGEYMEEILTLLKDAIVPIATCVLSGVISYIVSVRTANKWVPAYRKKYEELRIEIAESLTMYANLYTNPIDIAKTENHQLPQNYAEVSSKLRNLASKLKAFSETMPPKIRKVPSKQALYDASECLIGLSNSFTTPYNSNISDAERRNTHKYENDLRRLLQLPLVKR